MLNLDFSSVPTRDPLEEGMYNLTIAKAEEKLSSGNNPMLVIEFDVDGVEGKRKLWDNYVLVPQSLFRLKDLLAAIGIPTDAIVSMDPNDLVGQCVQAKVIQEEYNGDTVNRIKKVYPAV